MGNEETLITKEELGQEIIDGLEAVLPPVESKMDVAVTQTKDNDWLYVLYGVAATVGVFLSGKWAYNKFFKKKPKPDEVIDVMKTENIVDSEEE